MKHLKMWLRIKTFFSRSFFRFKFRIFGFGLWSWWTDERCIACKANAYFIQTSSIAYNENLLPNKSQSRCKGFKTIIAKDWPAKTSSASEYIFLRPELSSRKKASTKFTNLHFNLFLPSFLCCKTHRFGSKMHVRNGDE